jgi:glycosyltransferase involved in cell wall biosynthesis
MIAPLFSGSGIKIKVLEGMALGRVVLTTPVGAEGIPAKHGEHLFLASTPEEFLRNLDFCMENKDALPHIGQQARAFIGEHFDNLKIAENLLLTYERLLKEKEK